MSEKLPPRVEMFPFLSGVRSTGPLYLFEVVHQSTSGQGKMYGSDIRRVFPLAMGINITWINYQPQLVSQISEPSTVYGWIRCSSSFEWFCCHMDINRKPQIVSSILSISAFVGSRSFMIFRHLRLNGPKEKEEWQASSTLMCDDDSEEASFSGGVGGSSYPPPLEPPTWHAYFSSLLSGPKRFQYCWN